MLMAWIAYFLRAPCTREDTPETNPKRLDHYCKRGSVLKAQNGKPLSARRLWTDRHNRGIQLQMLKKETRYDHIYISAKHKEKRCYSLKYLKIIFGKI
jgi:hypothetical protein